MAQLHSKNWTKRSRFLSGCALCTLVAAFSLLSWQDIVRGGLPEDDVRASRGTMIVLPEVQAGPREEDARADSGMTIAGLPEGAMALKNQSRPGSDIGARKITTPVVPVLRIELSPPEDDVRASRGTTMVLPEVQAGPREEDARADSGTTIAGLPEGAMALKNRSPLGSDIGARKITAPVVPVLRIELPPPEDEEFALLAAYRVSDSELEGTRGGFVTASGLVINIGITGLVFVNSILVSTIPIFDSFVAGDTGVVAAGANVTRGNNGGLVVTTDINIVPDIVATGAGGADVELITGPAGTQVIHHISATGLAVEVINSNNNLFLQTQTDISIVLENWSDIASTLQLSGVANELHHSLSSAILGALP